MYTNIKNVQYLIAMLKVYQVKKVVVSPGNSHNAIVRSMEEDGYFETYSVVDERSAAFFACGIAQETKKPVAICCTAGTAATNYMSGVTEAYRRNLPLVIITGDKNPYYFEQYEDQMIDQISIFKSVTRYGCRLPIIQNSKDEWYCQRILNEALLELNHHGMGPVHIDVPIENGMLAINDDFLEASLPDFHKIDRYDLKDDAELVKKIFSNLKDKKIMIICGQDDHVSKEEKDLIQDIFEKYNCIFATDKLSNVHVKGTIEVTRAAKRMSEKITELCPDIVISIAGNTAMDVKFPLKRQEMRFEHWIVNDEGRVADPFRKLTTVFEGTTLAFLRRMSELESAKTNHNYFDLWRKITDEVVIPDFPYSNMYTVQKLMKNMPSGSNYNISNSTTIRIAQFFDLDERIEVFCNRGVNGIDGCASTFIGQAAASSGRLNFLVIGDLTFFYDMNSVWNRYVGKNVRIMLSNNEGAALFHFNQGLDRFPSLNENVAAEHFATAKGWVESQGFCYLSAHTKEEFDQALPRFLCSESDKPIFFEVFTKKDEDARIQHDFYDSLVVRNMSKTAKDGAKKVIKSLLGDEVVKKLKGR